ncbi:hypothetical protein ATY41_09160 [Leifsonia xyli subsp. xyli]|uniref:DUF4245 domain-containing protein n=1 Tax=Leifsonia xyli subsp. xyli TaxID=59736 RepID=A0A1E2SLT2_LEIXY|nr:DUF4245 domain-containing protein [Leifsonia xyli]ODA90690.1 hypothetical protein ATY41_09160 [Leifsonia xyli subsp. xyli]
MSPRNKPPAVVAELGRPETPEETAARRAQNSANHRNRQTVNNLVYSLIATVTLVIVIVLAVPRGAPTASTHDVDFAAVAQQAQGSEPDPLLVPELPDSWTSNSAQFRTKTADGVDSWYIGLLTPKGEFIGVTQGFEANESWMAGQVNRSRIAGTRDIDGVRWDVYDNRTSGADTGNVAYALTTTAGKSSIVVFGTAGDAEFQTVAAALAGQIRSLGDA